MRFERNPGEVASLERHPQIDRWHEPNENRRRAMDACRLSARVGRERGDGSVTGALPGRALRGGGYVGT